EKLKRSGRDVRYCDIFASASWESKGKGSRTPFHSRSIRGGEAPRRRAPSEMSRDPSGRSGRSASRSRRRECRPRPIAVELLDQPPRDPFPPPLAHVVHVEEALVLHLGF